MFNKIQDSNFMGQCQDIYLKVCAKSTCFKIELLNY